MTVAETMRRKLTDAFAPTHLAITDDSHKHAGHSGARAHQGGESHFTVEITSPAQFAAWVAQKGGHMPGAAAAPAGATPTASASLAPATAGTAATPTPAPSNANVANRATQAK